MNVEHRDADVRSCTRCPELVASRTQVVVGRGAARARVLVVGTAPGPAEDAAGVPAVGRAGRLLDRALAAAGLGDHDVHVTTLVKCLPPANRDPTPGEVARCQDHLLAQATTIRPVVVVALGSYVTKLLRGRATGLEAVRGRPEPLVLGDLTAWLYPVHDPAAALYAEASTAAFLADVAAIPALLAGGAPEVAPEVAAPVAAPEPPPEPVAGQLGLF